MKGFDCAFDTRSVISKIVAAGVGFVERYIGVGSVGKRLTPGEAAALLAAGIDVVSVVEAWAAETGIDQMKFTFASGSQHALAAVQDAERLGQPHGSAIYFAVDGDVLMPNIRAHIIPYFQGIAAQFGGAKDNAERAYRVGVYGSGLVGHTLLSDGLADLFQIANAHGWSGYRQYKGEAHLVQGAQGDAYGFGHGRMIDADEGVGDYGGWNRVV